MRARWPFFLASMAWLLSAMPVGAQEIRSRTSKSSFEDVKFELTNAVVNRGLVIDFQAHISTMLERTGKDVGSEKPIYKSAEYITFCSAKLSRQMMEADARNIAFCPYVIFFYETVAKPGEVTIGYRVPVSSGNAASKAAVAAVERLLSEIVRDAAK